ncbi:helix-turn-helix domain-containing protein [Candidatus Enterococcus ferrettii]|uniref:Mga helix-turn-helix domain-containing protein n=1 Tax=Candidatus Enterococcus ferrettii TaxID=2815324 RepID=A0ABV0EPP3_9ENTE|nr:helix-turn-helix domain-containing protein [Enterococcus sp. 665A]MBO1342159.1 helix-turn-helix domain-containing protein [Enterococcus sp. 665A]
MKQTLPHFSFISSDEQLTIELSTFLSEKNRYVPIAELTDSFLVSPVKIREILKVLEDDLGSFQNDAFFLDVSKKKGAFLSIDDDHNLKEFISFIILRSPLIQLFTAISFQKFVSVTNYAQENFLSESTVRRSLKRIRSIITPYEITITKNSYLLSGSETQIRYFLFLFFWRIYRGITWPFPSVDIDQIITSTNNILQKKMIQFDTPIEKKRFMFFLAVCRLRISNKNHIKETDLQVSPMTEIEKLFIENFPTRNIKLGLSLAEKRFFFQFCKGLGWLSNLTEQFELEKLQQTSEYQATEDFFNRFQKQFFLIPTEKKLAANLFIFRVHTVARLFKNFHTDMNGFFYNHYLINYYPELTGKLSYLIADLISKDQPLFKQEQFLLIHYLMLVASVDEICRYEKTIYLVYDSTLVPLLQEEQINRIYSYFKDFFHLDISLPAAVNAPDKINFVLTSIPLPEYSAQYPNAKILTISRNLKVSDLMKLESNISEFIQPK